MKKILITIAALFLASISFAETIQCKVVDVNDGDTITCLTDEKKEIKVRLWGIDAPEPGQNFGQKSKKVLSEMIFNKEIVIDKKGVDKYKRTQGVIYFDFDYNCNFIYEENSNEEKSAKEKDCTVNDDAIFSFQANNEKYKVCCSNTSANYSMIYQGYAWYYPTSHKNPKYEQAEQEAREAKHGLWADPNPIPPWEWRKYKGKK